MSGSPSTPSSDVRAERRGALGLLTLDRPQALNALTLEMLRALSGQLIRWADDPAIGVVLLRGASRAGKPTAFCAGGDIRFFHLAWHEGDPRMEDFFTEEYALDHLVHRYPKPVIALMDGITMGGGMGIAQGANLRVLTEHSRLAMPETRIGLFPDVGGGWFLSRCPGRLGEYLGLTGASLGAADAMAAGWGDVLVAAARQEALVDAVAGASRADGSGAVEAARAFALEAGTAPLAAHRAAIDHAFAAPTVAGIVQALDAMQDDFARSTREALAVGSPLMLCVALAQIRRARHLGLADALRLERGLMRQAFRLRPGVPEPVEGIRALAIDKDQAPRWNPSRLEDVDAVLVEAHFDSPWPNHAHPLRALQDH